MTEEVIIEYLNNQNELLVFPYDSNTKEMSQTNEYMTKSELELNGYKVVGEIRNGEVLLYDNNDEEYDDYYDQFGEKEEEE